jgi:Ca2+-binding RTX toxin-like protein
VGSPNADWITGTEGDDQLNGMQGDDILEGSGGNDILDGATGSDELFGGDGEDTLYGSAFPLEYDYLNGGRGNDTLLGGLGMDVFGFQAGDGQDLLRDTGNYQYFEFDANVDPSSIALYYTDTSDAKIRLEYGFFNSITSFDTYSVQQIRSVTVGGIDMPLVQRSDLEDGTFYSTYWSDVFETGSGNDTIQANGIGDDVYRFSEGDGQDLILLGTDPVNTPRRGEILFSSSVDLESLSFSFNGEDAVISYGSGDHVTLDGNFVGNALTRFTIASEVIPSWVPVIRSPGSSSQTYGTYGTDHIIGGASSSYIRPGYGNDLIEGGDSADWITLNDMYLTGSAVATSIGSKQIRAAGGDDFIVAPLYQGLTFYFDRGDGHDTIDYDWSYSSAHPYQFLVDEDAQSVDFVPAGEDTLIFGDDILLADLGFTRFGDDLNISFVDGSGSIFVDSFFHAWDSPDSQSSGNELYALLDDGRIPSGFSLLDTELLALLPATPISKLSFSNGDTVEMSDVLNASLVLSNATMFGTEANDNLYGTEGDDVIHAYGGDDFIEDAGGHNVIDAGAGNDEIRVESASEIDAGSGNDEIYIRGGSVVNAGSGDDTVNAWGDNSINPGSGDDMVWLNDGDNIVHFGPGYGTDRITFDVDAGATLIVEMAADLTLGDILIFGTSFEGNDFLSISLPATGDVLVPMGVTYQTETNLRVPHPHAMLAELRFSNGTVLSGEQLFAMASPIPDPLFGTAGNDEITGSQSNDLIIGGAGDDVLRGGAGADIFLIEGHGEGMNHIIGGEGFDTILGSSGDDTFGLAKMTKGYSIEKINGGSGYNTIVGNSANNSLNFSATELINISRIDGGDGDDTIHGSHSDDVIVGGRGNDVLRGNDGDDIFWVEGVDQGIDHFIGGNGFDAIQGGNDDDIFNISRMLVDGESIEKIDGGLGLNRIVGTVDNDNLDFSMTELLNIAKIDGAGGNDIIRGSQGDDVIVGGLGSDTLRGLGGDDVFLVAGQSQGVDRFIGGSGFDTVMGTDADDTFAFSAFLQAADSIEKVDGGLGTDRIVGSQDNNTLDFRATELASIASISGGDGDDLIFGSEGNDVAFGGSGNDTLSGHTGDDFYVFWRSQGQDTINNDDANSTATDSLWFFGIEHDDLWLYRSGNNLLIDVVGTDDQVAVNGWYARDEDQLDAIYTNGRLMLGNQVDQLVSAMASFDVPVGVGAVIPQVTQMQLESTLSAVWQTI